MKAITKKRNDSRHAARLVAASAYGGSWRSARPTRLVWIGQEGVCVRTTWLMGSADG